VFISMPDTEAAIRAANLDFVAFCEEEFPVGSIAKNVGPRSKVAWRRCAPVFASEFDAWPFQSGLEHLPEKLAETGVEALVLDTVYFFLELVPMRLGVPYIHIWNVLNIDLSGATPACIFNWPHETGAEAMARNAEGLKMLGEMLAPLVEVAKPYAEGAGLQVDWNDPNEKKSKLALISQTPKEFDFPNSNWPDHSLYAGPFHDNEGREPIPFPWEKLNGKPLMYASMGTLVNGLEYVYRAILGAVEPFTEMQVVLSVGSNIYPEKLGTIPANPIVVPSAPQIELLKQAALCITHAGLNTTLESLAQRVPIWWRSRYLMTSRLSQPGLRITEWAKFWNWAI
jgi:zeaxanthin glucosyltransferase